MHLIPERDQTAHPYALLLGGGDLVADSLTGHLALKLSEGQQDVEGKASIDVVVLNCWVTATNDTPRASNSSTILAKSASVG